MKFKNGDEARVKRTNKETMYKNIEGTTVLILDNVCGDLYKVFDCIGGQWILDEEMLERVVPTLAKVKERKLTCCINVKNIVEAQFLDAFFECKSYLKDYCMKKYTDWLENIFADDTLAFQLTNGIIIGCCFTNFYRSCGGKYGEVYEFSDLFPVGSTMVCGDGMYQRTESGITNYKLVPNYKEGGVATLKPRDESASFASAPYLDLSSLILPANSREFEEKINKELAEHFNAFPNDGISAKNGGKNSMKFTFYTVEGYRMDKSNNTKIPTVTTEVVYKDKDGCATGGLATCDKADYNSRQGVLEALANMCCGGNFDREYNKAVKDNARADKKARTCTYCGQLFDTVADKNEHEAWHVECRNARHERYLLRKRAKEIAFEEAAQKMAKEIISEGNKK